jgi:glycosyltransferase involved in cell wall biosynthesis
MITPALYWGGAERQLLDLARFSGDAIEWTGIASVSQMYRDDTMVRLFEPLMPVRQHGREACEAVACDAEALVAWGSYDLAKMVAGFRGPVVFTGHGSGTFDQAAVRNCAPGATHFVAVARASLPPFASVVDLDRVEVLHNGIDPDRCRQTISRDEMRRRLGVAPGEFVCGYVGRMVPEKNPLGVARAVAPLPARFRALFVGGGWDLDKQRAKITRVLGRRAIFVDRIEDVGNYYRALDLFVQASPAEGFSMGMLEAMLCGVPCALTDVGVLPELEARHGRHWETVPPGAGPQQLTAAIIRAASLSPEKRAARVARCRAIVETRFLARHMAERWVAYLRDAVAGYNPAPVIPATDCNAALRPLR